MKFGRDPNKTSDVIELLVMTVFFGSPCTKNIESDLFPLSAPQKGSYMAPVWKNDSLRIKSFAPPPT